MRAKRRVSGAAQAHGVELAEFVLRAVVLLLGHADMVARPICERLTGRCSQSV